MTMTNLERIRKGLSPARRKKIEARAAQLVAEEMTLQELRQARKLTQVRMAKALGITQDGVSRLEKRSDLLLSTLRKSVQAMGVRYRWLLSSPTAIPWCCQALPTTTLGARSSGGDDVRGRERTPANQEAAGSFTPSST